MGDNRVGTLRLSGDVAVNFVNSFFFPTNEEIAERAELRRERNQHINISKSERGFSVEIDDLDLSVFDEPEVIEEQITVSVSIKYRHQYDSFFRMDSDVIKEVSFQCERRTYSNCNIDELDKYAA